MKSIGSQLGLISSPMRSLSKTSNTCSKSGTPPGRKNSGPSGVPSTEGPMPASLFMMSPQSSLFSLWTTGDKNSSIKVVFKMRRSFLSLCWPVKQIRPIGLSILRGPSSSVSRNRWSILRLVQNKTLGFKRLFKRLSSRQSNNIKMRISTFLHRLIWEREIINRAVVVVVSKN